MQYVWVFCEVDSNFPSAVFSTEKLAREWIDKLECIGTLTQYPIDISAYDFAVENGYFQPHKPHHSEPGFIAKFSNANNKHYHFRMDDECE